MSTRTPSSFPRPPRRLKNGVSVGEDLPLNYADQLPKRDLRERRRAGVLLHPTSFTGPYGIGDIGTQAFHFLDWLQLSGCSLWQM
ncbi:hypothetical protein LIER_12421 [Lithospermum erythrorhizon]|uniref:4-alpha-glucanotransferase n=1 Tax=Lithospermum erythrorhizon TaxID=34254 RepID=A0AAV3PT58_LITER